MPAAPAAAAVALTGPRQALIFVSRTRGFAWLDMPHPFLLTAFTLAQACLALPGPPARRPSPRL